jgi:hypothetical protein
MTKFAVVMGKAIAHAQNAMHPAWIVEAAHIEVAAEAADTTRRME